MAIHAGALSGENIIMLTEICWQRTFYLFQRQCDIISHSTDSPATCLIRGQL